MTSSKDLYENCDNTVSHRRRSPRLAMNSNITTTTDSCSTNHQTFSTPTSNSRSENCHPDGEEMGVNISVSVHHQHHQQQQEQEIENNEVIVGQDDSNEQIYEVGYSTPKRRPSKLKMPELPRINRFLPVHWDKDMHETRRCLKF